MHTTSFVTPEISSTSTPPWSTFLSRSEGLTRPCVIRNVLTEDMDTYHALTKEVFLGVAHDDSAKLRMWIDGQPEENGRQIIHDTQEHLSDSVTQWARSVFENRSFGIVMNDCEKYDDQLNTKILSFLAPLLQQVGYPAMGIDFTYFIGNYGYTPLGFHIDPLGHSVLHLHLGPGPKRMYLVHDPEAVADFRRRKGDYSKKVDIDTADYIDQATEYIIEPGDLFYMPTGELHIGRSDELSIGLTVWLRAGSYAEITEIAYTRLFSRFKVKRDCPIPFAQHLNQPSHLQNEMKEQFAENGIISTASLLDQVSIELTDHQYEIASNQGLAAQPMLREGSIEESIRHAIIAINQPFAVYHRKTHKDQLKIFVRGHRLCVPFNAEIVAFLDRLNHGNTFSFQEAKEILEAWEEDSIIYILQKLFTYRGIVLHT